ncbi:acetolactate synthase [Dioszegia hungarica]|uniref:Acetolactate synthase n=1 Tax=Dioszegia hungarica TaxID=4972 RepID=A0AA38H8D0_9TREE|nr:acetolactate synthase [Dioszegia hungarica]KAI9634691.1 acetolactate synthase [Dioszegia hungarica]
MSRPTLRKVLALKPRSAVGSVRFTNATTADRPQAPKPIKDSTSALEYKMHRPTRAMPQASTPRAPSAEEAVTNILYNTPPPSTEPYKRHLLNCLVQNEPGVLSRVSGILAGRGFNIDSLVVCQTEVRDLSRMCIVLKGQDGVVEQARRQLEDIVPVWAVLDYTSTSIVERELLLAKISILGPEYAQEQLSGSSGSATHSADFDQAVMEQNPADGAHAFASTEGEQTSTQAADRDDREQALARSFEAGGGPDGAGSGAIGAGRKGMSASEALIAKNLHLSGIKMLVEQFGGKVVDVAENSCVVELTAKSSRVDNFLGLMRSFGVLEAARSGVMVLPRTPVARYEDEEETMVAREEMDLSLLPPG